MMATKCAAVTAPYLIRRKWGVKRLTRERFFSERPCRLLHFGTSYRIASQPQLDLYVGVRLSAAAADHFVLVPFAMLDENLAGVEIYIVHSDVDQLRDAHSRVEQEPEHDLVLQVSDPVDHLIKFA
jgi:hypothetical protein